MLRLSAPKAFPRICFGKRLQDKVWSASAFSFSCKAIPREKLLWIPKTGYPGMYHHFFLAANTKLSHLGHHLVHRVGKLGQIFVGVGQVEMNRLPYCMDAGVCPPSGHDRHVRLEPL